MPNYIPHSGAGGEVAPASPLSRSATGRHDSHPVLNCCLRNAIGLPMLPAGEIEQLHLSLGVKTGDDAVCTTGARLRALHGACFDPESAPLSMTENLKNPY